MECLILKINMISKEEWFVKRIQMELQKVFWTQQLKSDILFVIFYTNEGELNYDSTLQKR